MQVKGNIGEEVYLKAKIKEIHILGEEDIQYTLEIDKTYGISIEESDDNIKHHITTTDILKGVPVDKIKFKLKPTDIVNNKISEEKKKGPGRPPKKATIDSLMEKVEEKKSDKEEVNKIEGNQVV